MSRTYLANKKILIVLPQNKFQDEEFLDLKKRLDYEHVNITTVTCSNGKAVGINGTEVYPDIIVEDVDAIEYDAISLIGGVGSIEHWHNREVIDLINEAYEIGEKICAICLAPVTLANAGILTDKKATAYGSAATYLSSKGAIYTGKSVEISGNIITANGPEASDEFARAIVESLTH